MNPVRPFPIDTDTHERNVASGPITGTFVGPLIGGLTG